ncbi:hypothetical protein Egran_05257 [Elaphomyces granulatus]|uniref:AB hydrolase-1 domain-containing protein n=1 Tax=Elaphomyces granulatus TaxID=519963 RepID=A0A232LS63_9EURO|nr:hypothetical protein Egran_05257 [Elaphomyces granulatus]
MASSRNRLLGAVSSLLAIAYGLFTMILYLGKAIEDGRFFRRPTEKEKLELQLARDRFWNLSKQWSGLSHQFLTLHDGFRFHYLCSHVPGSPDIPRSNKPLVIFIHGFPDSWAIWRHILSSPQLRDSAFLVAVDLPGYGGSDCLDRYSTTNVLEKLTEFIVAIRERYEVEALSSDDELADPHRLSSRRVIIVSHDWGCVLATRLAAEAPQLADRFILSNGPVVDLILSNLDRHRSSATKMFNTFLHAPLQSRSMLPKALKSARPVFRYLWLTGYIFVLRLPTIIVSYFGSAGNHSFLKWIHKDAHGKSREYTIRDAAESMASTLGPSAGELKTETTDHEQYPSCVLERRGLATIEQTALYYRHGTAVGRWSKSIETITALHSLDHGNELRRTSSGAGLFDDGPKGALKAKATFVWGKDDVAIDPHIALDGIGDYLAHNSQVIMLPRSGHFTPVELESRLVIEKVTEWAVRGEKEDVGAVAKAVYPEADVTVRT